MSINENTTNLENILDNVNNISTVPVLLWTNASPTSNFAAQTVDVAGGYDGYLIECRHSTSTTSGNTTVIGYAPIGVNTSIVVPSAVSAAYNDGSFRVVTAAEGGVSFSSGWGIRGTSSGDYYCIPTRIWGVKFTL